MRLGWLALLFVPVGPAIAAGDANLLGALDRADTVAMTRGVEQLYRDAGLSWNDTLRWELQPYDFTFNFHDPYAQTITLGAIPTDAQVPDYWANWSATLTGGKWQADRFFADPGEAIALARYNQMVLAIHEAGHAVTYRYDPDHVERNGYEVNCREFYADRLTASALQDLAAEQPRFALLRSRYVALIASMNAAIADKDRYHIANLQALQDNCAIIHVEQPTPDTLQPYASAFFERQRLLLSARLPSLSQAAGLYLLPHYADIAARLPYDPWADGARLTSGATFPGLVAVDGFGTDDGAVAPAFLPDGSLIAARFSFDTDRRTFGLDFGSPDAPAAVAVDQPYSGKATELNVDNVSALSLDRFLVTLDDPREGLVALISASRTDGRWKVAEVAEIEDARIARIERSASGRLYLLVTSSPKVTGLNDGWRAVEIDPVTLQPIAGPYPFAAIIGRPMAVDDSGGIFTDALDAVIRLDGDGNYTVFGGDGLQGFKDAVGPSGMEFAGLKAMQWLADGRLMLLDQTADGSGAAIRTITPAAR